MSGMLCRQILAICLGGLLLAAPGCRGRDVTFLGFAGGPPGGAFFPAAGAIGAIAQRNIPSLNVSVEGSGGSGENIRLVNSGDSEMGIAFAGDLHSGYFGQEDFDGSPQENLRAVGLLFWSYSHLVVLRDSGITTLNYLQNRTLAIGGTGTGSALTGERVFGHLGLLTKIRVSFLGGSTASAALKDGQVDAYHWHSAAPNSAVLDTVSTHHIRLLDLATAATDTGLLDAYPFYTIGELPAGTYSGVNEPVRTIRAGTYWVANKDVPDEIVYQMARVAYAEHDYMVQSFRPLTDMRPDQALHGLTIPLHPGAARLWTELGIDIPDTLRRR
jgi:uncharacterized protein